MAEQANELTLILEYVLIGIIILIMVIAVVIIAIKLREKNEKKEKNLGKEKISTIKEKTKPGNTSQYNKQSIFDFMEFDKIEDNMIIQKSGKRFLMVVECQGVNYDLMSEMEKTAVEEGFIRFLNTLRHPIQLYVQTRTVNLEKSIAGYKERLAVVEADLQKMELKYKQNIESNLYTKQEQEQAFYDLIKQRNLYEYSKDIINNTEQMNKNKNVLNKRYYAIIPYYSEEAQNDKLDQEEIRNLAFSELYTRAQSLARALSATGVTSRILNSNELADFLYVAYNRDEAETFGIDKAVRAGYDELYTTAPDVLDKKKAELDRQIEEKAIEEANNRIIAASKKELEIKAMIEDMDDIISTRVKEILEDNKEYIGKTTTEIALEDMEKEEKNKKEGETKDVETKKKTKRTRKTKAV